MGKGDTAGVVPPVAAATSASPSAAIESTFIAEPDEPAYETLPETAPSESTEERKISTGSKKGLFARMKFRWKNSYARNPVDNSRRASATSLSTLSVSLSQKSSSLGGRAAGPPRPPDN